MLRTRIGALVGAVGLAVTGLMVAPPVAAAPATSSSTVNITVNVISTQANPGDVTVVNVSNTTTYGTCTGLSTPGTATCSIAVPTDHGILLVVQASQGKGWHAWHSSCAGAPGPVCHLYVKTATRTAGASIGFVGSSPVVTTTQPFTVGNPPNCGVNMTVTANGTGFPANQPATLSDDGTVVASGTTDANGFVSLSYTSTASEPGIYRTLVLGASATANTDLYNSAITCFATSGSKGMISVTLNSSGLDANSSNNFFKFRSNAPVTLTADSTGSGSTTTPTYSCQSGTTYNTVLWGTRGVGTRFQYSFSAVIPLTCP